MTHNVPQVGDVALSPTRAKGHVAERRAAAPRSPRHPLRVPMRLRAVMRSHALVNARTRFLQQVLASRYNIPQ
jgi:hypothetical protein